MNKLFCMLILKLILTSNLLAQTNHFNLGIRNNGIVLGNTSKHNGLRFSIKDTGYACLNGIHFSLITENQKTNGIATSFLFSADSLVNGIQTGLITSAAKVNGISFAPIATAHGKINGIALSGLATYFDTANGVQVNLLGTTPFDFVGSKVMNGLGIGGLYFNCVKVNGVQLSSILCYAEQLNGVSISCFNVAEELHGIQIGLLNYAANNRKPFRKLPLINFHFRRKEKN